MPEYSRASVAYSLFSDEHWRTGKHTKRPAVRHSTLWGLSALGRKTNAFGISQTTLHAMPRGAKKPQPSRRQRRPRARGQTDFGATEITQGRVTMRPMYGPTVPICRSVVLDVARVTTDGGFFFDWALADVPNSNEFSALFAQWKLDRAAITFTWRSANEANPVRPTFTFAMDPFATSAPASLQEVLERPNRTWSPNAQRTVLQLAMKPRALSLSASGAGSGSLVINSLAPPNTFYPTSSGALAYGSLLLWIANWGATSGTLQVKQDYWFSFRSTK